MILSKIKRLYDSGAKEIFVNPSSIKDIEIESIRNKDWNVTLKMYMGNIELFYGRSPIFPRSSICRGDVK